MALIVKVIFVSDNAEIAVFARQCRFRYAVNHFFVLFAVCNKRGNSYKYQIMLFGKFNKLRRACHIAIVAHNFAANANRCQPCQTA